MAEIIKINGNTWRIEDGMVRFFLLAGSEKALFIDSGNTKGADLKGMAAGLTELPVLLMNTHGDPDHAAGNGAFAEFYMHPADEALYRSRGGEGKIIPLKDGQVLDLGGRPLKIIHIPGHTPGSVAVLDVNAGVLYSGDSVQNSNMFMFGPGRSFAELAKSLKKLQALKDSISVIHPSHGTFPEQPELIDKIAEGASVIIAHKYPEAAEGGKGAHDKIALRYGTAEISRAERFGKKIEIWRFPYGGFLCDGKENDQS